MLRIKELLDKYISEKKSTAAMSAGTSGSYYQAASSWYEEKYELIAISRNRYRFLSLGLGVLLALSFSALISLLPLKQYVYRLIEVNQQTGEVSALKEVEGNHYAGNWVVTRYFIHQYVLNRHLYSHEDITRTFNIALAMSEKRIADEYADTVLDTNPKSPLNVLGEAAYRDVTILGINQLNDNAALVRFKTTTHYKSNKNGTKVEDLQAVVKWKFDQAPANQQDRDKNPLGFYINYYQVSPVYTDSQS